MKKFIKYLAMLLTIALMAGLLYGCGGSSNDDEPYPTPDADRPAPPDTTGDSDPVQDPVIRRPGFVELNIFNVAGPINGFEQDDPIWQNNPLALQIYEDLNILINWEMPTGDGNERLSLLLSAGEPPDIIMGPNAFNFNRIVNDGIAIPLNNLIDSYGPNIQRTFGPVLDFLRSPNDNIYSLAREFGQFTEGDTVPGFGNGLVIRNDAWQAVGAPTLNSLDDVYNVLTQLAAMEQFRYNHEGDSVWPMGGFVQAWGNPVQTVLGAAGMLSYIWYEGASGDIYYWVRSPQALDIVLFFNRIFNEGLYDPGAFTLDSGTWYGSKVATARTLSFFGGWWQAWNTHTNFYIPAGIEGAENMNFVTVPFRVSPAQRHRPNLVAVSSIGNRSAVITTSASDAVARAAMQLFDYLSIPENNFTVMNGAEGIMWNFADGTPVMRPEFKERWLAGEGDAMFSEETGLRLYHQIVGTSAGRSPWGTYWVLRDDPVIMGDTRAAARDAALGAYWFDGFATGGIGNVAPPEILSLYLRISEMFHNDLYFAIRAGSEAEAIAAWEVYLEALETIGLRDLEAFANEERNRRLGR